MNSTWVVLQLSFYVQMVWNGMFLNLNNVYKLHQTVLNICDTILKGAEIFWSDAIEKTPLVP